MSLQEVCLYVLSTLTQLFPHPVCLFHWDEQTRASQGCVSGAPEPWNLSCLLSLLAFVPIESLDPSNTFNSASFKIDQKEIICLCSLYVVTLILKQTNKNNMKSNTPEGWGHRFEIKLEFTHWPWSPWTRAANFTSSALIFSSSQGRSAVFIVVACYEN